MAAEEYAPGLPPNWPATMGEMLSQAVVPAMQSRNVMYSDVPAVI